MLHHVIAAVPASVVTGRRRRVFFGDVELRGEATLGELFLARHPNPRTREHAERELRLTMIFEESAIYQLILSTEALFVKELETAFELLDGELETAFDVRRELLDAPQYFVGVCSDVTDLFTIYLRVHFLTVGTIEEVGREGEAMLPPRPEHLMCLVREYLCMREIMSHDQGGQYDIEECESGLQSSLMKAFADFGPVSRGLASFDGFRDLSVLYIQSLRKVHRSLPALMRMHTAHSGTQRLSEQ